jgi:hypothetical protein
VFAAGSTEEDVVVLVGDCFLVAEFLFLDAVLVPFVDDFALPALILLRSSEGSCTPPSGSSVLVGLEDLEDLVDLYDLESRFKEGIWSILFAGRM